MYGTGEILTLDGHINKTHQKTPNGEKIEAKHLKKGAMVGGVY
jgi:hypothetical protein